MLQVCILRIYIELNFNLCYNEGGYIVSGKDVINMRFLTKNILMICCFLTALTGCAPAETSAPDLEIAGQVLEENQGEDGKNNRQEGVTVSLWAGSMNPGFSDGENASAGFLKPYGLCGAPGGGVLIVDSYSNLLRVSADGAVHTLAGNTEYLSESGLPIGNYLNGNAGKALLNHPRFAAVSQDGAVVFSDTDNHSIRILKDGQVRLLAGTQTPGFHNGSYDTAQFNTPSGVAIGETGVVYVADTLNHCIRQISAQGQVTTLAGVPGQAGYLDGSPTEALFCEPNDIQLGEDGALYVVDKGNQRIRRITSEQVTTIAGSGEDTDHSTGYIIGGYEDGSGTEARFLYPTGLYIREDMTIYVADTGNHCIRVISPDQTVATIAGTKMSGNENGLGESARFNQPLDVYYEDGNLYVSDSYNHVIRLVGLLDGKGKDAP